MKPVLDLIGEWEFILSSPSNELITKNFYSKEGFCITLVEL
jgi:hypothetical protein